MTSTPQNASHRHARAGTIVWGAILVAASVFAIVELLGGPLSATTVLWSVVGFASVLIVAAAATAIVRAARATSSHPVEDASPDGKHPPVG